MKRGNLKRLLMTFGVISISFNINYVCFADAVSDARNELNSIKNQISQNASAISAVEDEVEGYLD